MKVGVPSFTCTKGYAHGKEDVSARQSCSELPSPPTLGNWLLIFDPFYFCLKIKPRSFGSLHFFSVVEFYWVLPSVRATFAQPSNIQVRFFAYCCAARSQVACGEDHDRNYFYNLQTARKHQTDNFLHELFIFSQDTIYIFWGCK